MESFRPALVATLCFAMLALLVAAAIVLAPSAGAAGGCGGG
ncbi:MAG TPA: hypothetical protein VHE56_11635 [Mycobacteriales bacterium]|nr:hypothetical protein [Mycobacteriales bacterium]